MYTDRHFSPFEGGWGDVNNKKLQKTFFSHLPFEGSPRAGAAEYVQRGDVNNKEQFAQIRYAKVIKKYQSAKKRDCPFWGQSRLLKNIDELITLNYFVEVSFKHPHVLFLTRDEVAH